MKHRRLTQLLPVERVEKLIHVARGEKVLLDTDLARLYGVSTGNLNKAVKRNLHRFPPDFIYQLSDDEAAALIFQSGRSKRRGGRRHNPYAFTEQGVAMLSSVLRSERAVQVNVAIMRAFVSLRRMLAHNDKLARKLAELERRLEGHDQNIRSLFDAIRELMSPPVKPPAEIGFHTGLQRQAASAHRRMNLFAKRRADYKADEKALEETKSMRLPFRRSAQKTAETKTKSKE